MEGFAAVGDEREEILFLMFKCLNYLHRAKGSERTPDTWVTGSPHPVVIVGGGFQYAERIANLALYDSSPKG